MRRRDGVGARIRRCCGAPQADRLAGHLAAQPERSTAPTSAWTLATARARTLEHRAVVVGADRGRLLTAVCAAVAAGEDRPQAVVGRAE